MLQSLARHWLPLLITLASAATAFANADSPTASAQTGFWPNLGPATLAWFAAVVILALTLRLRRIFALRNLDALVLVAMSLLFVVRADTSTMLGGHTAQWWAYLGLSLAMAYWVIRGLILLRAQTAPRYEGIVSLSAITALLLAGLAVSVQRIATAPTSGDSADAIVGGLYFRETGHLPYGQVPAADAHSPLLYLAHAGALAVLPPTFAADDGNTLEMSWNNRSAWIDSDWVDGDVAAARVVNAVLFVAVLLGLYVIGRRLKSAAVGPVIMAIFCVFPGTLECLPRPEIMLSAALLTWTIVFALLGGLGGLLATFCLVFAGLAWPWTWLALPVLLAYFVRRRWQLLGSLVGLAGGVVLIGWGLLTLVQPAMPRATAALAIADQPPAYTARLADPKTVIIDQSDAELHTTWGAWSTLGWRWLLNQDVAAVDGFGDVRIDRPNGTNVLFREIAATSAARNAIQPAYCAAVAELPGTKRGLIALRTLLEATWLPAEPAVAAAKLPGTWELWGGRPMQPRWVLARRMVKIAVALLTLLSALALLMSRRIYPRHLVSALLIVGSGAVLASTDGAVTNLAWLLPLVLTLWAVYEVPESKVDQTEAAMFVDPDANTDDGPAPRITYEE